MQQVVYQSLPFKNFTRSSHWMASYSSSYIGIYADTLEGGTQIVQKGMSMHDKFAGVLQAH